MILKYKSSKTIHTKVGFDIVSTRIISNLKIMLNQLDACTEVEGNTIRFKCLLRNYTPTSENRVKSIKFLREGEIRLIQTDGNKIKLEWEVKLDSIGFLAMLIGMTISFFSYFSLHIELIKAVITGLVICSSIFLVGRYFIIAQMEELIGRSCSN